MNTHKIVDLTGDPAVEEQIRQYYIKKRNQVRFTEGVETRERNRAKFTIDNSQVLTLTEKELEVYNRNISKAWDKHYKADKSRRRYEEQQKLEYTI